jgi:hypothetical protein
MYNYKLRYANRGNHFLRKCEDCGAPHRHRNRNKYPDKCKPCALKQMHLERKTNGFYDKVNELRLLKSMVPGLLEVGTIQHGEIKL